MTETTKACPGCDSTNLQSVSQSDVYYCRDCNEQFPQRDAVVRERRGHGLGGRHGDGVRALLDASPDVIGGADDD